MSSTTHLEIVNTIQIYIHHLDSSNLIAQSENVLHCIEHSDSPVMSKHNVDDEQYGYQRLPMPAKITAA